MDNFAPVKMQHGFVMQLPRKRKQIILPVLSVRVHYTEHLTIVQMKQLLAVICILETSLPKNVSPGVFVLQAMLKMNMVIALPSKSVHVTMDTKAIKKMISSNKSVILGKYKTNKQN